MTTKSIEVRVGIVVIVAAVILSLGVIWIGEVRFNRKWQTYSVYFDEIGGLSAGDPVAVAGLEMGKVGKITLEGNRIRADLLIEEEVVLRDDSSVEIRSIGLMGEKFVYIMPGAAGEILPQGAAIEGEYKSGLPEVVAEVGDMMDEMKEVAESITTLLAPGEEQYSLAESLGKLTALSDEILRLLRENRNDIRVTAKNVRAASEGLGDIMGGGKDELITGIQRFSSAAARLDTLTIALRGVAAGVEKGEGTLGMLIKERRLHEEMEATLENLNNLINDIREHPERYIKIEIF